MVCSLVFLVRFDALLILFLFEFLALLRWKVCTAWIWFWGYWFCLVWAWIKERTYDLLQYPWCLCFCKLWDKTGMTLHLRHVSNQKHNKKGSCNIIGEWIRFESVSKPFVQVKIGTWLGFYCRMYPDAIYIIIVTTEGSYQQMTTLLKDMMICFADFKSRDSR